MDAGIVNLYFEAFANQMLGNGDDGAFAQVVGAGLEGEAIQADAAGAVGQYESPFAFGGEIGKVTVDLAKE